MPDMKDLELDLDLTTGTAATEDDFSNLLNTVINATESGDPAPKPHDVTIPVPNKTEITVEQYNRAKEQLIRSLKESADLLAELDTLPIVEGAELSLDEQQEAYTEAVELDAICRSYMTGPYFEAAKESKKKEIVEAVAAIKQASKTTRTDKYGLEVFKFMKEDIITDVVSVGGTDPLTTLTNFIITFGGANLSRAISKSVVKKLMLSRLRKDKTIKAKLWQMVGSFYAKEDELSDAMKYYTELFKDQLAEDGLKLRSIKLKVTRRTKQRNYDGYCYLLIVADSSGSEGDIDIQVDDTSDEDKK